jgi:hypothetical protein
MPHIMISRTAVRRVVLALALPWAVQSAVAAPAPCQQIVAACKSSGFVAGDFRQGFGLWADCVDPIVRGSAPPANTDKPLPVIAPEVVAACKQQDPAFGQRRKAAPPPPPPPPPAS